VSTANSNIEACHARWGSLRSEAHFGARADRLNPLVRVDDEAVVLDTAAMGAAPLNPLKRPLTNLRSAQGGMVTALNTLVCAF
jgi:hypothetical protein